MNKREKEVIRKQLSDEEKTLNYLKQVYKKSAEDIREKIAILNSKEQMQDPNLQTIIYQRKYQEAILKQIETGLEDLNKNQYKTLQEFLEGSYANGYVGSMYNFDGQGIPLTVPIDPKKVIKAVQIDSKLSKKYYQNRVFPENIQKLKLQIKAEVSRGIASGKTWVEVAHNIASGMNSPFTRAFNDAVRIVRTEGHRVNQQGFLDAGDEAKKSGADILKQWDSTLDARTRPAHQEADGQIREWDEDFTVMGEKMKAPSIGGSASNVINCRCQLLQRARWALDEEELKTLQDRAKFYGLDKTKDFEEYKEKFLNLPVNAQGQVESFEDMEKRLSDLEKDKDKKEQDLTLLKREERYGEYLEHQQEITKDAYSSVSDLTEKDLKDLQKLADKRDEYLDEYDKLNSRLINIRSERPRYSNFTSEEEYDKAFEKYLQLKQQLQEEKDHFWELYNQGDDAKNKIYRYTQFKNRYDSLTGKYKTHLELLNEISESEKLYKESEKAFNDLRELMKKHPDYSDEHLRTWTNRFKDKNVKFNPVSKHTKSLTQQEIIDTLAGNDRTDGSCASVGFTYIGQKKGFDVRDFRGGTSMQQFRKWENLEELTKIEGLKVFKGSGASSLTVAKRLIKQCEVGKEYYLVTGRHASIVRKTKEGFEYLELQSSFERGWTKFDKKLDETFKDRFGCTRVSSPWHEYYDFMIDVDDPSLDEKKLEKILGYLNTAEGEEMKGAGGSIK